MSTPAEYQVYPHMIDKSQDQISGKYHVSDNIITSTEDGSTYVVFVPHCTVGGEELRLTACLGIAQSDILRIENEKLKKA